MRRLTFLSFATLLSVCASAQTVRRNSSTQDIEAKVALESSVERRLQEVLRRLLDSEDVVVVVNAELLNDADRADVEVLPGVNVKESPGTASPLEIPPSLVRRLSVTLFLERGMSEDRAELARKTAARIVGFKTERGDSVVVERMDFPKKVLTPAENFRKTLLEPRGFLSLSWLLIACAALLLSRRLFDPFVSAIKEASRGLAEKSSASPIPKELSHPSIAHEPVFTPPTRAETVAAAASSEPPRRIPFSFMGERDLPTLAMLLEEQSSQIVSTIINFLPPALASAALTAMPAERRDEVIAQMASPVLLNPEDVQSLENSIRARIDCMIGGEDKLAEILDQCPTRLQTEILDSLRLAREDVWEKVHRRVVVLNDLSLLDEEGLGLLSRAVPLKSMAAALRSSPHLATLITEKLKTGLGQWLKQEIDFSAQLPPEIEQAETRRVVKALSDLVRDGRITLKKPLTRRASDTAIS